MPFFVFAIHKNKKEHGTDEIVASFGRNVISCLTKQCYCRTGNLRKIMKKQSKNHKRRNVTDHIAGSYHFASFSVVQKTSKMIGGDSVLFWMKYVYSCLTKQ